MNKVVKIDIDELEENKSLSPEYPL